MLVLCVASSTRDIVRIASDAKDRQQQIKVIFVDQEIPAGPTDPSIDCFVKEPFDYLGIVDALRRVTGGRKEKYGKAAVQQQI